MANYTKTVVIDKATSIAIHKSLEEYITISLTDNGDYVVMSNGSSVLLLQQATEDGAVKQQYEGDAKHVEQTAFSNMKVKGDLIINGLVQQSIG